MKTIRMFLWLSSLTGLLYPLLITGIALLTMRQKAEGDFIEVNGNIVGAKQIAQKFEDKKYFWGRPSYNDYSALPSQGSNLAPIHLALKELVEERRLKLQKEHLNSTTELPPELLFASASGLDPHISVTAATFQMDRVAKARRLEVKFIQNLIDRMKIQPFFGLFKEDYVNVLLLNLQLDETENQIKKPI